MGERENRAQLPTAAALSRVGSHIVKSTGRKDRHSKVSTAKGLRDRRVRLSAHTAIQFYDVQDRLGYDRPSKAVDWLIMHSKAAIEKLDKLSAWNPIPTTVSDSTTGVQNQEEEEDQDQNLNLPRRKLNQIASAVDGGGGGISEFQQMQQLSDDNNKYNSGFSGSGFLPYDADIANTIKSFFPTTTASFQSYPSPLDLLSRETSVSNKHHQHYQQQDLRLSLQSFQDPILLHKHHHQNQNHHPEEQVLFAGNTDLGFDNGSSGWSEQQQQEEQEHGRLQRMMGWNNVDAGDGGGGFTFNAAVVPATAAVHGHGQYLCSQRGPLQSSNTPSVRAWIDPSSTSTSVLVDNHQHCLSPAAVINQSSMGFATPTFGGFFSNFRVPARIQGEEEHDGVSEKSSSASSDSRH